MLHCFPIHQVCCENKATTRRAQKIISSSPFFQSGITFTQDANVKARQQNRKNLKSSRTRSCVSAMPSAILHVPSPHTESSFRTPTHNNINHHHIPNHPSSLIRANHLYHR
jgi:hypothetical protein